MFRHKKLQALYTSLSLSLPVCVYAMTIGRTNGPLLSQVECKPSRSFPCWVSGVSAKAWLLLLLSAGVCKLLISALWWIEVVTQQFIGWSHNNEACRRNKNRVRIWDNGIYLKQDVMSAGVCFMKFLQSGVQTDFVIWQTLIKLNYGGWLNKSLSKETLILLFRRFEEAQAVQTLNNDNIEFWIMSRPSNNDNNMYIQILRAWALVWTKITQILVCERNFVWFRVSRVLFPS